MSNMVQQIGAQKTCSIGIHENAWTLYPVSPFFDADDDDDEFYGGIKWRAKYLNKDIKNARIDV